MTDVGTMMKGGRIERKQACDCVLDLIIIIIFCKPQQTSDYQSKPVTYLVISSTFFSTHASLHTYNNHIIH